ncbi:MAG: DEAD/DEAH box helicase [Candidatus Micrarchaeota archaeon]|nr:DEAD/DEAH box helicase [Candidatus Micrarchaeota archaeon]
MEFSKIGLDPAIAKAIKELGFVAPTEIQQQALPLLIQGEDVIGQAKTGTGKTAAFGICILERLLASKKEPPAPGYPLAVVLCPTRELAVQVAGEISKLGKYLGAKVVAIYGGQEIEKQIKALSAGADVVVGTPGRVLDHLARKTLSLSKAKIVVLDEADRMLDMGFREDIDKILQSAPADRQTLLFSATLPPDVLELAKKYMKSPQEIRVSADSPSVEAIKQYYVEVPRHAKFQALLWLLKKEKPTLAIIFVKTKISAERLSKSLQASGFYCLALHGDMSQRKRDLSMSAFRKKHISILVATDLASRGLDVEGVSHVINFDLPSDHYSYIHRIGRTGRAGKSGKAISLVFPDQLPALRSIEEMTKSKIEPIALDAALFPPPKSPFFAPKISPFSRKRKPLATQKEGTHRKTQHPSRPRSSRGHHYFGRQN